MNIDENRLAFLRGVLAANLSSGVDKSQLEAAMSQINISGTARAEEVSVTQWIELYDALRS